MESLRRSRKSRQTEIPGLAAELSPSDNKGGGITSDARERVKKEECGGRVLSPCCQRQIIGKRRIEAAAKTKQKSKGTT